MGGMPRFVAVGHQGIKATSDDGREWKVREVGKEGQVYRAVDHGNGRIAAIGSYGGDNIFASSTDGASWKFSKRDARYSAYLRGLAFGKGTFLAVGGDPGAVGSSNPIASTSTDGVSWTEPVAFVGKNIIRRMAFGKGRFVGVGDRGRRASTSDGLRWTDVPDVKAVDTLVDVAFGNGVFVGVGLHGLRMRSVDGLAWTDRQVGDEGQHLNTVLWAVDRFYAVGAGATYASFDGRRWDRRANTNAPLIAAFGDGVFVGANWRGRILRSTDAVAWDQVFKSDHHFEAIAFAGD